MPEEPPPRLVDARCPTCGYDRAAPNGAFVTPCPECGDENATRRLKPWPSTRRLGFVLFSPALFDSSLFLAAVVLHLEGLVYIAVFLLLFVLFWPLSIAATLADGHTPYNANRRAFVRMLLVGWGGSLAIVATAAALAAVYAAR